MCLANGSIVSSKKYSHDVSFWRAQKMANQRECLQKKTLKLKEPQARTDSKRTCDKNEKLVKSP
jgi:hypothetical protein